MIMHALLLLLLQLMVIASAIQRFPWQTAGEVAAKPWETWLTSVANAGQQTGQEGAGRGEGRVQPDAAAQTPGETSRYASQAYNRVEQKWRVEPRTGAFSFRLPIAHLHTHHKRSILTLQFHQRDASTGYDPFGLGVGWSLNLPHITRDKEEPLNILHLHIGDGTVNTLGLMKQFDFDYYEMKDIVVSASEKQDEYYIRRNGDLYILDNGGYFKKLKYREGYELWMDYADDRNSLKIHNERGVVFELTWQPATNSYHAKSKNSAGRVHYEIFKRGKGVRRIRCHSCPTEQGNYEFTYSNDDQHIIITSIVYPSGMIERMEYVGVGRFAHDLALQQSVSRLTQFPGDHTGLTGGNPDFDLSFNYHPINNDHSSFLGDNDFVTGRHNKNKDSLMETKGNYNYYTEVSDGKACVLYKFDKFHRVLERRTYDCHNRKKTLVKWVLHYDCDDAMPAYSAVKMSCKLIYAMNTPAKLVQTTYGGYSDEEGVEETFGMTIDEFGKPREVVHSNGKAEHFTYEGSGTPGTYRRLSTYRYSAPYHVLHNDWQGWETRYAYTEVRQWRSNSYYTILSSARYAYFPGVFNDPRKRIVQRLGERTYQYHDTTDYASHGRVKEIVRTATDSSFQERTNYEYSENPSDAVLTVQKLVRGAQIEPSMSSGWTVDAATGWLVEHRRADGTGFENVHDPDGRLRIVNQFNDRKQCVFATSADYRTQPGGNYLTITLPGGSRTKYLMDNMGRVRQKLIAGDSSTSYTLSYNNFYNEQGLNIMQKNIYGMETRMEYDAIGRITKVVATATVTIPRADSPNKLTKIYSYSVTKDRLHLEYSYLRAPDGNKDTGYCIVKGVLGQVHRQCQILDKTILEPKNCDTTECLLIIESSYDAWNRNNGTKQTAIDHNSKASAQPQTNLLVTTSYDYYSRVQSKTLELHESSSIETVYAYDNLFGRIVDVSVAGKHIASRRLTALGQIQSDTYSTIHRVFSYNAKQQLVKSSTSDRDVQAFQHDHMGRLRAVITQRGGSNNNDGHIWDYAENGMVNETVSMVPSGIVSKSFIYNERHNKVSHIFTHVTNGMTEERQGLINNYDALGRLIERQTSASSKVEFSYDNAGRLSTATWKSDSKPRVTVKLTYNEWSYKETQEYEDHDQNIAVTTKYACDEYHRISSIMFLKSKLSKKTTQEKLGEIQYTYDEFSRINERRLTGITEHYKYDSANRLIWYDCKQSTKGERMWQCPAFNDGPASIRSQKFAYDNLHRMTFVSETVNNGQKRHITYTYKEKAPYLVEKLEYQEMAGQQGASKCQKRKRFLERRLMTAELKRNGNFQCRSRNRRLGNRRKLRTAGGLGIRSRRPACSIQSRQNRILPTRTAVRACLNQKGTRTRRTGRCRPVTQLRRQTTRRLNHCCRFRKTRPRNQASSNSNCQNISLCRLHKRRKPSCKVTTPTKKDKIINIKFTHDVKGNVIKVVYYGRDEIVKVAYDSMSKPYQMDFTDKSHKTVFRLFDYNGRLYYQNVTINSQVWSNNDVFFYKDGNQLPTLGKHNNAETHFVTLGPNVLGAYKTKLKASSQINLVDSMGTVVGEVSANKVHHFSYEPFGQRSHDKTGNGLFGFHGMLSGFNSSWIAQNGRIYSGWLLQFLQRDPASPFGIGGFQAYSYAANSPTTMNDRSGFRPMEGDQPGPSHWPVVSSGGAAGGGRGDDGDRDKPTDYSRKESSSSSSSRVTLSPIPLPNANPNPHAGQDPADSTKDYSSRTRPDSAESRASLSPVPNPDNPNVGIVPGRDSPRPRHDAVRPYGLRLPTIPGHHRRQDDGEDRYQQNYGIGNYAMNVPNAEGALRDNEAINWHPEGPSHGPEDNLN